MRISDWSSDVCSSDLRIIVNTHALVGRGEKIQMMTECEPCAAHEGAGLIKQIGKLGSGLCTREFKLEGVGGVDRRHYEPWRADRRFRTSRSDRKSVV